MQAADEYAEAVRVLEESLRSTQVGAMPVNHPVTARTQQANAELEQELANLRTRWAEAELQREGWEAALSSIEGADAFWTRGAGTLLGTDDRRFALIQLALLRGRAHWGQGRQEMAEAAWRNAETLIAEWRSVAPADPDARLLECQTRNHLAKVAAARGDWIRAVEQLTMSDLALVELLREFPEDEEFAEFASETLSALADALKQSGKEAESAAVRARAAAVRSPATAPVPTPATSPPATPAVSPAATPAPSTPASPAASPSSKSP